MCLLLPVGAQAQQQASHLQDYVPQFEVFTLPGDPYAANYVQCIAQDSLGVLWFATQDGLRRNDGRNTTTLHHDPLQENSLVGDYVQWIHVAKDGTLWVADYGKGLTHYDQATGKFTRFRHNPNAPNSLSNDTVSMIVEDRHGAIWVGTHNGLIRLYRATGTFRRYYAESGNPHSLSSSLVRALYIDHQGALWVGCGFLWDDRDRGWTYTTRLLVACAILKRGKTPTARP